MKGKYSWKIAQKREVIAKFADLKDPPLFVEGKKTEFAGFKFCQSGLDAGSVWVYVGIQRYDNLYRDKLAAVNNYLKAKFGDGVHIEKSIQAPYPRNCYGVKFYPYGFPKVEVTTDGQVNTLVDYCIRSKRSQPDDYRLYPDELRELAGRYGMNAQSDIRLSSEMAVRVCNRFNERFSILKEQANIEREKRTIELTRLTDTGVWRAVIMAARFDARDKSIQRLESSDAVEVYRFIRQAQVERGAEFNYPHYPYLEKLFSELCAEALDALLGTVAPKTEETGEPSVPSFLND